MMDFSALLLRAGRGGLIDDASVQPRSAEYAEALDAESRPTSPPPDFKVVFRYSGGPGDFAAALADAEEMSNLRCRIQKIGKKASQERRDYEVVVRALKDAAKKRSRELWHSLGNSQTEIAQLEHRTKRLANNK